MRKCNIAWRNPMANMKGSQVGADDVSQCNSTTHEQ
jgi:hypothetical protein